jgi:hypothetical protein
MAWSSIWSWSNRLMRKVGGLPKSVEEKKKIKKKRESASRRRVKNMRRISKLRERERVT